MRHSSLRSRRLRAAAAQLLSQPPQDFVFCLPHRRGGHPQIARDFRRRAVLKHGKLKRSPSCRLEIGADRFQCSIQQLPDALLLAPTAAPSRRICRRGESVQGVLGPTGAATSGADAETVGDLVASHDPEPTAKGLPLPVADKTVASLPDGKKDLLQDVSRVAGRQSAVAAPAVNQRRIQRDQPLPRSVVAVLCARTKPVDVEKVGPGESRSTGICESVGCKLIRCNSLECAIDELRTK